MIPKKAITFSQPSPWIRAHLREDFDVCAFAPGSRVLDVGCGYGKNLEAMKARGIDAVGIDPDPEGLAYCLSLDFKVQLADAEKLPFADASFDGVVLDSVLQFTDPATALAEAHRVLRPGGEMTVVTQGVGYALNVILSRRGTGRLFGVRMILSTLRFALTGGRIGDTLCFSGRPLSALCERAGFRVESTLEGRRYFGLPVFTYMRLRRP